MTTEQPKASQQKRPAASAARVLRRRSDDRVIGGVASGLGAFLNVDPLLIRIGFVGLMVFGGLGLILYVGAWLLVPDETMNGSIAEQLLDRAGLTTNRFLIGLLLLAGAFLFVAGVSNGVALSGFASGLGAAIVVIVVGAALLRQGERHGSVATPPIAAPIPSMAPAVIATKPKLVAQRRRRPSSPLGWYVLGAMLAGIGVLALATNVSGADVDLGQFFGLALGVLGIGLVVGTWWGHARLLILLGMLVLPFAVVSSFVTAPLEGGLGSHQFRPFNPQEVRDEYRLVGGEMVLDLTDMAAGEEPIAIAASVAFGRLVIALPIDASVELDARVGAGDMLVFGAWQGGSSLADRFVRDGEGPRFVLDLEAGIGSIRVDGGGVNGGR